MADGAVAADDDRGLLRAQLGVVLDVAVFAQGDFALAPVNFAAEPYARRCAVFWADGPLRVKALMVL